MHRKMVEKLFTGAFFGVRHIVQTVPKNISEWSTAIVNYCYSLPSDKFQVTWPLASFQLFPYYYTANIYNNLLYSTSYIFNVQPF